MTDISFCNKEFLDCVSCSRKTLCSELSKFSWVAIRQLLLHLRVLSVYIVGISYLL
jgi:hypothetical protein